MYLGKADVNTYDKGVEREFLVSNGVGGYGSSTVVGANTRSEHGLLVVRPSDSEHHTVLVSKLEETLYAHNKKYNLSTNRYKDLIYPDGYRYLQEYQATPYPNMLFVIHSIFLKKSIFMPQNGTCAIVKYELLASPEPVCIDIRPLFAHRINKELTQKQDDSAFESNPISGGIINVKGRGYTSHVSFTGNASEVKWSAKPMWIENLIYENNPLPDKHPTDSLWSPGFGTIEMKCGDVLYVVLSEEPVAYTSSEIESLERETIERLNSFIKNVFTGNSFSALQDMVQSSYHLVADNKGAVPAIFSGFPSVERRARDTFIALPGLTLATGRPQTANAILDSWLERASSSGGLMPSSINAQGNEAFGDIDSGLWFLYATEKYSVSEGLGYATEKFAAIKAVLEKYIEGPLELGAVMDSSSKLIKHFNGERTRHWMSGDVDGEPLVERRGYLVEINALWYNALRFVESVAASAKDHESETRYASLASEVSSSFESTFWNESNKYLYDWVDPSNGERDDSIRPNALLAVSLPHSVLRQELGQVIFTTCWNELYTTYGLRTLDPHHEKFKGRAEGRLDQKKKARLRGMAWPWLLGQFISAYMRYNPESYEMGWSFLRPFSSHLRIGCLGGVAEYFDGVMPYKPHGDVLSAMSLGDLLRVAHEDLTQ
ncbi:MAG: amylo-alpha-1,6-glucosidase [Synergistaceae bacterium]|jgi:predicted glycogen debranching enzyme|nr:amylo-alpha-1,6-glucosidase [Synergistaceae bacterium]